MTDGERSRFRFAGPLFWVVVVLCLAYLPIFLGQILFYRDPAHWNYPARWFVRASVLRGDWPLWNPEQGLGFSVLANPLYGLFYPPNWLFLITPRGWVANMLTWQCFAHVVWGSAGVVVLARQLGLKGAAVTVAGLAWGLSGYTTASWTAGLLLLSGAWLPWCGVGFVSLARSVRGGGAGWIAGVVRAALPVAMAILLGEVFAAIIDVGFGLGVAALAVYQDRATGAAQPRLRTVTAVGTALALAGGIGAVVVLPARVIAATNARGQPLARAIAETCSLNPRRLLELVAPGSMGYPFGDYVAAPWIGEKMLDGYPLMYSVYMGAGVVALAVLALGRKHRLASLVGACAVFALLVSLGSYTPVHNIVRTVVRPLSYMRYPEKYLVAFVALLALLAGLGTTRVLDEAPPRLWRRTAVGAVLLLLLAALAPALFPAVWAPYMRWGAVKGALAVLLVLAVQALSTRASPRALALLLVAGVAADLAVAAWPYLDFAPRELATGVPRAATAIVDEHRRAGELAPPRVYRAEKTEATVRRWSQAGSHTEGEAASIASLIPNTVTTFGVATLPGYDAAIPNLVPQLWQTGQKVGQSVLRLLGISYVVLPIEDPRDPVEHRSGITPMLDPVPGSRLYRVPQALPRVYLAGRAEVVGDAQALARLFEPEVVEGKLALVTGGAVLGPAGRVGECALTAFTNSRVSARCQADRPAMAVFLEQHDAGWTANVDGAPAPLVRANLLMRAVALPAGTHEITLSYTPPGFRAGALLSLFSTVILTVMSLTVPFLRRWRRAPR